MFKSGWVIVLILGLVAAGLIYLGGWVITPWMIAHPLETIVVASGVVGISMAGIATMNHTY